MVVHLATTLFSDPLSRVDHESLYAIRHGERDAKVSFANQPIAMESIVWASYEVYSSSSLRKRISLVNCESLKWMMWPKPWPSGITDSNWKPIADQRLVSRLSSYWPLVVERIEAFESSLEWSPYRLK